jgi:glucokinase
VSVRLLNDLEATAYGALFLADEALHVLNRGTPRAGNRAIIAAGTGLGQAFLTWNGTHHHPVATEGGHADFAPRDDLETALLHFLGSQYDHVSWERVLSGPGLVGLYRFLTESQGRPASPALRAQMAGEDPAAAIGTAGVSGTCPTAVEAVDLFLHLYGAQAGNLALTVMAVGGVYVGGGIAPKLLSRMTANGGFVAAFTAKGRYAPLMADIPVWVILDPKTARLGAAEAARALLA